MSDVLFLHSISRKEVESGDYSIVKFFDGLDDKGLEIRKGNVYFSIDGYNHDKRQLGDIPEVVKWMEGLWKRWDKFMFFSSVRGEATAFGFIDIMSKINGKSFFEASKTIEERFFFFCNGENKMVIENKWQEKHDKEFISNFVKYLGVGA